MFVKWVMRCISTFSYSILVNGRPLKPFKAARSLSQGDILSPFLFALGMDYLSKLLGELNGRDGFFFSFQAQESSAHSSYDC